MKLKVITYFWAVGKKTKLVKVKKYKINKENVSFDLNRLPAIVTINDDSISIEVKNPKGEMIKNISFKSGEKAYYRPFSMDAGYEYVFKTCRF